jgi:hypothetical protein
LNAALFLASAIIIGLSAVAFDQARRLRQLTERKDGFWLPAAEQEEDQK